MADEPKVVLQDDLLPQESVVEPEEELKEITLADVLAKKVTNLSGVTPDDLHKIAVEALEKARGEEKKKLHDNIEKLSKTIEQSNKTVEELASKLKEKETEVEDEKKSKKSVEEKMRDEVEVLKKRIDNVLEAGKKQQEEYQEALRRTQVEAFKEKKLRSLKEDGVNFIEAIITGNTEEEIEESISKAVTSYQEVFDQAVEAVKSNTPVELKKKVSVAKPTAPVATPEALRVLDTKTIKDFSHEEWAKIRMDARRAVTESLQRRRG